ncbi:hypothetical protein KC336_g85 [Hortaea werneckii]|nr:hypothetical protein KC336_g85 [Hortaea werneckii]
MIDQHARREGEARPHAANLPLESPFPKNAIKCNIIVKSPQFVKIRGVRDIPHPVRGPGSRSRCGAAWGYAIRIPSLENARHEQSCVCVCERERWKRPLNAVEYPQAPPPASEKTGKGCWSAWALRVVDLLPQACKARTRAFDHCGGMSLTLLLWRGEREGGGETYA